MIDTAASIQVPHFGDVAHLGHLELLTPKFDASLAFFTSVIGLHESGQFGDSVYLRGWGDYEWHTLKLTAATSSGLGHIGLRVRDQATLEMLAARLKADHSGGEWIEDPIHGPAFRCRTPDGHAVELYFATRRFVATPDVSTAFKNQPQRYVPRGIAPRRLDHINLMAADVSATRRFFHELLGLRLTEQIIFDDGVRWERGSRRRTNHTTSRSRVTERVRKVGCITSRT